MFPVKYIVTIINLIKSNTGLSKNKFQINDLMTFVIGESNENELFSIDACLVEYSV